MYSPLRISSTTDSNATTTAGLHVGVISVGSTLHVATPLTPHPAHARVSTTSSPSAAVRRPTLYRGTHPPNRRHDGELRVGHTHSAISGVPIRETGSAVGR